MRVASEAAVHDGSEHGQIKSYATRPYMPTQTSPIKYAYHPRRPHTSPTSTSPPQGTKPPKPIKKKRDVLNTHRSVAICSFAIALRSSWLVAADVFVSGVPAVLPFTDPEPVGVDVPVVVNASPAAAPLAFADCFAAFSARRFCFEAEGAIVRV